MVSNPEPLKEPTDAQIEKRTDEILEKADFEQFFDWGVELGLEEEMGDFVERSHYPSVLDHIEDKLRRGEMT